MSKKPPLSSLSAEEYDARLRKILMGALGKAWMFWPPRAEAKRRCAIAGKPGWFRCEDAACLRETEKIEIDHIIPCIKPADGWEGWDKYIESRFVRSAKQLQGLCHESHLKKTKEENAKRRETKQCAKDAMPKEKKSRK